MTISNLIQAGVLLITLLTLIFNQRQQIQEIRKKEQRTANKLKIFFLCQNEERTQQEIIQHYKGMNLDEKIDEVEIRKTIYEMLVDETLRYRANGTFKARRNKVAQVKNNKELEEQTIEITGG